MSLPVNIHALLHGDTVEWDRIELKQGWNPEDIIHTIGAFANDINNWGGGYIFIGVEETDGKANLPPKGIEPIQLDKIQKELLNLSHRIQPYYAPVSQPYVINGKHILVIWAPGGDNRPYKVPATLGDKGQYRYYIRRGSSSVIANQQEEQLLFEMAKRIPFDDRINHHADISALSFGTIRSFLEEIKSTLSIEAPHMSLTELALQMHIATGPAEDLHPLNAGLLFFSEQPHIFFRGAKTEVILYDDATGSGFTEKLFTGPLHIQLRNVLSYLETNVIKEKVAKTSTKAEAIRVYNFPLAALEEIVANAFYHKSYELDNPIEINCFPDRIEILSFPGPLPPVSKTILKQKRIVARNYRNRRVGDFLKELKLTEGRATGFPTIYNSMEQNGSPLPLFETDDNFTYFLAVLPVHQSFLTSTGVHSANENLSARISEILKICLVPKKRSEILSDLGLSVQTKNYRKYIEPLLSNGLLALTEQNSVRSPQQRYYTTETGKAFLKKTSESAT